MTRPRSLVGSAAQTYGTNVAVAVLSLVNVLVVSRILGASGRGEVAFLITVTTMSSMLAGLSVQEANGVIAANEPQTRGSLATNSVLLAIALGVLGAGIVAGLVQIFPAVGGPVPRNLLYVTLAAIPVRTAQLYFASLVQADYAFKASNIAWLSGPSVTAVFNTAMGIAGVLTVGLALGVWIAGQILGLVILVVYVLRHAGFGRADRRLGGRMLGFGLRVQVSRIMNVGNYRADQWIVGSIAGSRELGLYSVAAAWAEMLFYLPGVLVVVQRPDLTRATRAWAGELAAKAFRASTFIAVILGVGLIIAAPFLCTVIFGEEFSEAVPMLRILALGAVGLSALELLSGALIAQKMIFAATVGIAVAAVIGITLNFVLVPDMGGDGASVAAIVGYSIGGIVTSIAFCRVMDCRLRELIPRADDVRWLISKSQVSQLRSRFS